MKNFRFEWNDFLGGYYVGPSAVLQPKNTWTGQNVILSDDDSTLIPCYQPTKVTLTGTSVSGGIIDTGTTATQWSDPVYFNGFCVLAAVIGGVGYLYYITGVGVVTRVQVLASGAISVRYPPVVVPAPLSPTETYIYCCFGTSSYYRVTKSTGAIVTITPASGAALSRIDGMVMWGARLLLWSTESAKMIYSNALAYSTVANTNFVNVGYEGDPITAVIPRQYDLIVGKPSGWYSLTGVLGTSAALRLINDTLGIVPAGTYPGDPVTQHNSNIYFFTTTNYSRYAINLFGLNGTRIDIAAYQRFGTDTTNLRLSRCNMGYMAVSGMVAATTGAQSKYIVYIADPQDRWSKFTGTRFISSSDTNNTRFVVASSRVSRYNNMYDQYLWLFEIVTNGTTENKLSMAYITPNGIEPGRSLATFAPTTGTVMLRDIDTPDPTKINKIYVEADIMQLPTAYTGNATMTVTIGQVSRDYLNYDTSSDPTSVSGTQSVAFSSVFSASSEIQTQTRTLVFDTNSAGYGYNSYVKIDFAGYRIRRVWAEGTTR